MFEVSQVRISEIARLTGYSKPLLSRHFKSLKENQVTLVNKRIVSISPEAVEQYFKTIKLDNVKNYYRPSILLSANLCGGVGKTTSIYNLGASLRRLTSRTTPIVYIDGDSQGSFTSLIFGKPAEDKEPILTDFFEEKANIDQILVDVGQNTWFIKSNLNQVWLDKILAKPTEIKKGMLKFYSALIDKFGRDIRIFQDHTPQLSNLFASSLCALSQLPDDMLKAVIIPIRGDKFAIQGAEYIIREITDLKETFALPAIQIHCFISSLDRRVSTSAESFKMLVNNETLRDYISPVVIRYCSEIPKGIMHNNNVYHKSRETTATQDFQDLLSYIYNYNSGN